MWLNISSGERGRKEETETCKVCKYSSWSWIAGLRGETRSSRGEEMWFRPQTPVRLVISGRGDAVSSPGTRVPRLDYSKLILNSIKIHINWQQFRNYDKKFGCSILELDSFRWHRQRLLCVLHLRLPVYITQIWRSYRCYTHTQHFRHALATLGNTPLKDKFSPTQCRV